MKKRHSTFWILAGAITLLLITQFSAIAADKVMVIPLFRSGDEIPTVISKTGRVWMDRNLGAIRVAGSKSDSLAYGWLYQWGRPADGHESRTSPVSILNNRSNDVVPGHGDFIIVNSDPYNWLSTENNNLWQGGSGVNNPCPTGFQIPTQDDWQKEIATWSIRNADGAYQSVLKITLAGTRQSYSGEIWVAGNQVYYWAADTAGGESRCLEITGGEAVLRNMHRAQGLSVRCIKN